MNRETISRLFDLACKARICVHEEYEAHWDSGRDLAAKRVETEALAPIVEIKNALREALQELDA